MRKPKYDIHKAAGVIIKDRKILVVKSNRNDYFIAPGGKIEIGESPQQALIRELKEELQIVVSDFDLFEFGTFTHPAAGKNDKIVCMEVFIVKNWIGDINPDHEIIQTLWLSSIDPNNIEVGSVIKHEIIPRLKASSLID